MKLPLPHFFLISFVWLLSFQGLIAEDADTQSPKSGIVGVWYLKSFPNIMILKISDNKRFVCVQYVNAKIENMVSGSWKKQDNTIIWQYDVLSGVKEENQILELDDSHMLIEEFDHSHSNYLRYKPSSGTDTDQDGMDDDFEISYLLNPLSDDSKEDPNSDGVTNLEHFQYYVDAGRPVDSSDIDPLYIEAIMVNGPLPGHYYRPPLLTILQPKNKNITVHFTMDGSEPTLDSPKLEFENGYSDFVVGRSMTLKMKGFSGKFFGPTWGSSSE